MARIIKGSIRRTEPDEDDMKDGITFDRLGRMQYHPDFHPNHRKPITLGEKIYIAKYYDSDGMRSVGFALGRTESTIAHQASLMRMSGEWDRLRAMSEEAWLTAIGEEAI